MTSTLHGGDQPSQDQESVHAAQQLNNSSLARGSGGGGILNYGSPGSRDANLVYSSGGSHGHHFNRHYHYQPAQPYPPLSSYISSNLGGGEQHQRHHYHSKNNTSMSTPTARTTTNSTASISQYYSPLRPLGSYLSNNANAYSSPPVPLVLIPPSYHRAPTPSKAPNNSTQSYTFRTSALQRGDTKSAAEQIAPTSDVPSSKTGRQQASTTKASYYYPHTNLQLCEPPSPLPTPIAHNNNSNVGSAPQPLRQHNAPQPLVPCALRNVYTSAVPAVATGQENVPHTQVADRPPLSDKQILRARLAQRGIFLDHALRIGSGRYSKVMTAQLRDTTTIAIKIINTNRVTTEFRTKFLPREIECWERLNHAHLVKLMSRDEFAGRIFLFMEYGHGGDVLAYVQKNGPIPEPMSALWMRQIISGLSYMHKLGVVHRDLKLENIIIFQQNIVKIADFGFARKMTNDLSVTYCGSKSYSAPEILSGQPYNPYKADIWSLGVIAYVIVTDRMPFKDSMPNAEIVHWQRRRNYTYPPQLGLSSACRHTIDTLLTFDWAARPDIHEAARMPWFVARTNDQ